MMMRRKSATVLFLGFILSSSPIMAEVDGSYIQYYPDGSTVRAPNMSENEIFRDMNRTTLFNNTLIVEELWVDVTYPTFEVHYTFSEANYREGETVTVEPSFATAIEYDFFSNDSCEVHRAIDTSFRMILQSGRIINQGTSDHKLSEAEIISWYGGPIELEYPREVDPYGGPLYIYYGAVSSYDDPVVKVEFKYTYPEGTNCILFAGGFSFARGVSVDPPAWSGTDTDGDQIPDVGDNCPLDFSIVATETGFFVDLTDTDSDGIGDLCDEDKDGDGVVNNADNCPLVQNADQADADGDLIGDVCDSCRSAVINDGDCDGYLDGPRGGFDNCPRVANPDQADLDGDGVGDLCDDDIDNDSIWDKRTTTPDNCPFIPNTDQVDTDSDGLGDACDAVPAGDLDGDGIANTLDNCVYVANTDQLNTDGDTAGDACDPDDDNDSILDVVDACSTCDVGVCGNGIVELTEECDDGNQTSGDWCSSVCSLESVCGNGLWEGPEECDDGNLLDLDGCSSSCLTECPENLVFADNDGDGFGNPENTIAACSPPSGYSNNGDDCNDGNASINPAVAFDVSDCVDNDCDGDYDEDEHGGSSSNYLPIFTESSLEPIPDIGAMWFSASFAGYAPLGFLTSLSLADRVPPDAILRQQTINFPACTKSAEGSLLWEFSQPGLNEFIFSFGIGRTPSEKLSATKQVYVPINVTDGDGDDYIESIDCNDSDPTINLGATEVLNGIDDNCNGLVDEGLGDGDSDGVLDGVDNCPVHPNADQFDSDYDNIGDACDDVDDSIPLPPSNVFVEPHVGTKVHMTWLFPSLNTDGNLIIDGLLPGFVAYSRTPNVSYPSQYEYAFSPGQLVNDVYFDVAEEATWYFVVYAHDTNGNFSGPSAEVSVSLAPPCLDADNDGFGVGDLQSCAGSSVLPDNCPAEYNADQLDIDSDGAGDICDVCPADALDQCDPNSSAGETVGSAGGTVTAPDGSGEVVIPAGALQDDISVSLSGEGGASYILTDRGQALSIVSFSLSPAGQTFLAPVQVILRWNDIDDDGIVDGTAINERSLRVVKDGEVIAPSCGLSRDCDTAENTFAVFVTSFSQFALVNLNEPPIVSIDLGPVDPVPLGLEVSISASYVDSGFLDTHSAQVHWGDGATTSGTISSGGGAGSVIDTHIYATPGIHTVTVDVIDNFGEIGSAAYNYAVVYDTNGSFVTGGGWIDSPIGACQLAATCVTLAGKANFGFVSKYRKGATAPTGNTEFQFKAGDLSFHSSSYDWLVIAGAKAMYKGTGTINGTGTYGFMLSAIDADLTPSTTVDLFRIKIWDKDNADFVVYDNQKADMEDADPRTIIGGGSIKIHKAK